MRGRYFFEKSLLSSQWSWGMQRIVSDRPVISQWSIVNRKASIEVLFAIVLPNVRVSL
jgi:hypothetical protein